MNNVAKIVMAVILFAAAIGVLVWHFTDRPHDAARTEKVLGEKAASAEAYVGKVVETCKNASGRNGVNKLKELAANPGDDQLGMFFGALRELDLSSAKITEISQAVAQPDRYNVYFDAPANKYHFVLIEDGEDWKFSAFYILRK